MKKYVLKNAGVLIILVLMFLSTISITNADNDQTTSYNKDVLELRFYQMDFYFDRTIYEDTDWGCVELDFVGQEPILYFNLAVNGEWQIQNIPVLSVQGVDVDQIMTYYFDLGNEVGEIVTDITYGYALTEDILYSMPTETHTAIVADDSQIMNPGFGGEMPDLAIAGPLIGAFVVTEQKYYHYNFPNQDCGKNECAPAAVSNSLKFLNKRHKLGLDVDDLSIDEMKDALDWDENGCDLYKWWEKKKESMEDDDDYPFTTRKVTDMDSLIEEIDNGQDVEIQESWVKNGKKTGHTSCLVGITKLENGEYSLDIAHDRKQGVDGGTEITTLKYNPNTKKLRCGGRITTFEYAVVECPRFSWFVFHWKDPETSGCFLEVYGTHDCERLDPVLRDMWAKKCRWYRFYLPMELDDEDVNDIIFDCSWWIGEYKYSDSTKYATSEYDDENSYWRLETVSTWVDENVEGELITYIIGDKEDEILELYVMVEMDTFLENPVPPQEEYVIINGLCEDLPGYLIGTTPIVFNPNAGPDENPFSTTPLEYYVLSNLGEIVIGPPENQAPYSPELSGPPSGKPGTTYEYTIVTTDPEDDNVYYSIDWGDGNTELIGPYVSGEEVTATHSWSNQGTYIIKAKAKDVYGEESEWSEEFEVTMPRNRAITLPFLKFLEQYPILYQLLLRFLRL